MQTKPMTAEEIRLDRTVSAYMHAKVDMEAAVRVLAKPMPHSPGDLEVVQRAAGSMQRYLTELEKQ